MSAWRREVALVAGLLAVVGACAVMPARGDVCVLDGWSPWFTTAPNQGGTLLAGPCEDDGPVYAYAHIVVTGQAASNVNWQITVDGVEVDSGTDDFEVGLYVIGGNASFTVQPGSEHTAEVCVTPGGVGCECNAIQWDWCPEPCTPVSIKSGPLPATICETQYHQFCIAVQGDLPVQYQWYLDDVPIPGATLSCLVDSRAGAYRCEVSNCDGAYTAVSDTVELTVVVPPSVTVCPEDQVVCAGVPVTFCADAEGGEPLSYQWRKNDEPIDGATEPCYLIDGVTPEDAGDYDVVVHNGCGSATCPAVGLTVCTGPFIVEPPEDQTVRWGTSATFAVAAESCLPSSFVDPIGSNANSSSGPRLRGNLYSVAHDVVLTEIEHFLDISTSGSIVFYVYEGDAAAGPFTLVFQTTLANSGVGQRFYSSGPVSVPLHEGQYYIVGAGWPGNHGYYWGGTHPQATEFGQTVAGFATSWQVPLPSNPSATSSLVPYQRLTIANHLLAYQWRKDDEPIPGADGSRYTIASVGWDDAGNYDVIVTDTCGSVVADAATLTVLCVGDLTGDGVIDLHDLAEFIGNYGIASGAHYEDGDLDGDGDVDLTDLAILLGVYGTTCP